MPAVPCSKKGSPSRIGKCRCFLADSDFHGARWDESDFLQVLSRENSKEVIFRKVFVGWFMIGFFWYSYNNHDMLVYLLAYVAHRKCFFFAGDECRGDSSSGQDLVNDYPNPYRFCQELHQETRALLPFQYDWLFPSKIEWDRIPTDP